MDLILYVKLVVHFWPPIVSVCLRTGHAIGSVRKRYLKYENTGEEVVGRILAGIPSTSYKFKISSVYFCSQESMEHDIEDNACFIFPIQYSKMVRLSRQLSATFIYHEERTIGVITVGSTIRSSLNFFYW